MNEVQEILAEQIPTGVIGTDGNDNFNISHRAIEMINKVKSENTLTDEHYLRIAAYSGGCSGMSYALGFDTAVNENDREYTINNLKLLVDAKSLFYVMGVTLDYVDGPQGSGFVFKNPNDFNTCGCHG